jgi:hypothetical protein
MVNTEKREHTIHIYPQAPAKVAVGAACNGCGICCLYAPCPLGMLLSHRRSGACSALRWEASLLQYRCGAVTAPQSVLAEALPRGLRAMASPLAPLLRRLGLRWIAAGMGCDSSLEVEATKIPTADLHDKKTGSTVVRHPEP